MNTHNDLNPVADSLSTLNISDAELELSECLKNIILDEIKHTVNQQITFRRYMELALYHPIYGYYNNWRYKFGAAGDYITAPLTSKIFASCFAHQFEELFNNGVSSYILEVGAGNGSLMIDLLSSLGDKVNKYYVLELSSSLKKVQQDHLEQKLPQYKDRVIWLSDMPREFSGIILANEVLDANPCDKIRLLNGEIYLQNIGTENGELIYVDTLANRSIVDEVHKLPTHLKTVDDYTTELHLTSQAFIKSVANSLQKGVVFFIDYGYGSSEFYSDFRSNGTLRGFFHQQVWDNVLIYPGLVDITSSVNFSQIAKCGIDCSLELIGYVTQANFLINCGIVKDLELAINNMGSAEYLELTNQVNRLISPNEMGDIFKVIAFSKDLEFYDFMGFIHGDRTYTL